MVYAIVFEMKTQLQEFIDIGESTSDACIPGWTSYKLHYKVQLPPARYDSNAITDLWRHTTQNNFYRPTVFADIYKPVHDWVWYVNHYAPIVVPILFAALTYCLIRVL